MEAVGARMMLLWCKGVKNAVELDGVYFQMVKQKVALFV